MCLCFRAVFFSVPRLKTEPLAESRLVASEGKSDIGRFTNERNISHCRKKFSGVRMPTQPQFDAVLMLCNRLDCGGNDGGGGGYTIYCVGIRR